MSTAVDADKKTEYLEKALEWIQQKGYNQIKSTMDGLEDPRTFQKKSNEKQVAADFTAIKRTRKHYFALVLKTDKKQALVSKLKLLSKLAALKGGKLFLFAPHGHKAFTQQLQRRYNIPAEVVSI